MRPLQSREIFVKRHIADELKIADELGRRQARGHGHSVKRENRLKLTALRLYQTYNL